MTRAIAVLAAALALPLAGSATVPVVASTGDVLAPRGGLTLFARSDFTDVLYQRTYASCATPIEVAIARPVVAYDNRPAPGCQAVLQTASRPGDTLKLCYGRGSVPALFQQPLRLRVQPGETPVCGT